MAASVTKEWFWQTALNKPVDDNYIFQKSLDRENISGITCVYSLNSYDGIFAKKISNDDDWPGDRQLCHVTKWDVTLIPNFIGLKVLNNKKWRSVHRLVFYLLIKNQDHDWGWDKTRTKAKAQTMT